MNSLSLGNNTATGTPIAATAGVNPTPPPSSNLPHLTESMKLEYQFLRVPFEHFKKTIRANHRVVEKEISAVISRVTDAASAEFSPNDAVNHLNSLVSRLQGLKRKLEEGSKAEDLQAQKCRIGLDHLESADAEVMSA